MCGGLESRFSEKLISFRTAKSIEKFFCVCDVKLYKVWKVSNMPHGRQRKRYAEKVCCRCGINPDAWEEAAQERSQWPGLINSGASAYKDCRCREAMQQHQLCKSRASEISPRDQPPHTPLPARCTATGPSQPGLVWPAICARAVSPDNAADKTIWAEVMVVFAGEGQTLSSSWRVVRCRLLLGLKSGLNIFRASFSTSFASDGTMGFATHGSCMMRFVTRGTCMMHFVTHGNGVMGFATHADSMAFCNEQ